MKDASGETTLHGVGVVQGVRNRALAVAAADDRARAELTARLTQSMVFLSRNYHSARSGDSERVRRGLEALAGAAIGNTVIVDHWRNPNDGATYALATLGSGVLKALGRETGLDAALASYVETNAAASFDASVEASGDPALATAAARPATAAPAEAPASAGGIDAEAMRRMLAEVVKTMAEQKAAGPAAAAVAVRSEVDAPSYHAPENPDNFAVVVGVEKYSGLPDAQFAERDAVAVRDHLIGLGYPQRNVVLLTGPQASRAGLAKNIEAWLGRNVNENSTVFFYYSGHGAPDPRSGQAYLVPVDGDPQYLEETAYPIKRLYERLGALKAKTVVVALDSCFSGAGGRSVLAKGTRPLVVVQVAAEAPAKVVSLSASDVSEVSGTYEEKGHGLFTYFFLKGLNGAAADPRGRITAQGLYEYLSPKVRDEARRQNREQTPMLHSSAAEMPAEIRLR